MAKYVKDSYEYGECPDCRKSIPHSAVEGDQCTECGCVFFVKEEIQEEPIDADEDFENNWVVGDIGTFDDEF